jgi:hypothetical protein
LNEGTHHSWVTTLNEGTHHSDSRWAHAGFNGV